MNRWSLDKLLPRGTETWQKAAHATTIHGMLASQELASDIPKSRIHDTENESDHRAIGTSLMRTPQIMPPNRACCSKVLPGTRLESALPEHCTIDQRVATSRDNQIV